MGGGGVGWTTVNGSSETARRKKARKTNRRSTWCLSLPGWHPDPSRDRRFARSSGSGERRSGPLSRARARGSDIGGGDRSRRRSSRRRSRRRRLESRPHVFCPWLSLGTGTAPGGGWRGTGSHRRPEVGSGSQDSSPGDPHLRLGRVPKGGRLPGYGGRSTRVAPVGSFGPPPVAGTHSPTRRHSPWLYVDTTPSPVCVPVPDLCRKRCQCARVRGCVLCLRPPLPFSFASLHSCLLPGPLSPIPKTRVHGHRRSGRLRTPDRRPLSPQA